MEFYSYKYNKIILCKIEYYVPNTQVRSSYFIY